MLFSTAPTLIFHFFAALTKKISPNTHFFDPISPFFFNSTQAQQKWNLKSIVEYAMANNINVKLSDVQARIADVNYKQNKFSQIPTLNLGLDGSLNSNTQSQISFARASGANYQLTGSLQSSGDIFNFFSKRNAILASKWEYEASKANVDKLKNDIALTAANAYLQILLATEQQKITGLQIQQTTAQLNTVRKQVDAGSLPELNASQLEAQLASDSVSYITAKGNVEQAILQLKAYMNIEADAPFEVEEPPVELIPIDPIADLQPELVYKLALANQPQQKVNDFKLKAAEKNKLASKGAMYPTLSGFGSLSTGYSNQSIRQVLVGSHIDSIAVANTQINGTGDNVFPISPDFIYPKTPFKNQVSDNLGKSVGVRLNIPFLSNGILKSNYQRSKLNLESARLQKIQDDQKLKQDIYQAYNAAIIALEKFNASKKSVAVNEVTYSYAAKRAEVGMLNTYDLITSQNNLLRVRLEYSLNQFDYVFKMKVLEFYKGQGLKL